MNIVVIPARTRMLLIKYCEEKGIEYRVISQEKLPDNTPGRCEFRDEIYVTNVVGFESKLNKDEIYDILNAIIPNCFKNS